MTAHPVLPWLVLGAGVIQLVTSIGARRGGRPGPYPAASGMSIALGISLMTSGWIRGLAWAVMAVYFVVMTVRLIGDRSLSSLVVAIPVYALMLFIAVSELLFDRISAWERAMFGAVAVLVATALVAMTVHLVQRRRARRAQATATTPV